ncbi:hypothetical protein BKI52_40655 [marine bacterium AO1-C]|nr:hypothetical protein BKI52_40655 [marine bacterium AO1-C]
MNSLEQTGSITMKKLDLEKYIEIKGFYSYHCMFWNARQEYEDPRRNIGSKLIHTLEVLRPNLIQYLAEGSDYRYYPVTTGFDNQLTIKSVNQMLKDIKLEQPYLIGIAKNEALGEYKKQYLMITKDTSIFEKNRRLMDLIKTAEIPSL